VRKKIQMGAMLFQKAAVLCNSANEDGISLALI